MTGPGSYSNNTQIKDEQNNSIFKSITKRMAFDPVSN